MANEKTLQQNSKNSLPKVGILGGGQLGRMLLQAAINYPVETYVLENDPNCPAAHLCHHFVLGDIQNETAVYNFGKQVDVLTIEIEGVNETALFRLEAEGVRVYPSPSALHTLKNKILQKEFYQSLNVPSADFCITQNLEELKQQVDFLPAVHKINSGGYDGRGVQVIKTAQDIHLGFDAPAVLEKMVDLQQEISVIVAVDHQLQTTCYPAVEMVFDPQLNQLDYQICPASITPNQQEQVQSLALKVVKGLNSPGIFAVELFIDTAGKAWINETAPRVHNSGHHSIEANYSSQFDMLWRILLHYPLGNTALIQPAAIINLVGAPNFSGPAIYQGIDEILSQPDCFLHLYGKKETRSGRKMGHLNILAKSTDQLLERVKELKHVLQIVS